jgi:hypothetical protein
VRYLQVVVQGMSLQARDGASETELLKVAAIARVELERQCTSPRSNARSGRRKRARR